MVRLQSWCPCQLPPQALQALGLPGNSHTLSPRKDSHLALIFLPPIPCHSIKSIMMFLSLKPETSCLLVQTPQRFPLPGSQIPHFLACCERPPESGTDITFGLIPSPSHLPFASYTILDCLLFSPDHLHLYTFPPLILLEECLLSPKVTSTGKPSRSLPSS